MSDETLYFARNISSLNSGTPVERVTEYQVVADSNIVGELHFGPYYFTIWEYGLKEEGEHRLLCLRVREATIPEDYRPWANATKDGFYHGGGIADEIVALSSLFLRRRLELGPVVRVDDIPRMFETRTNQLSPDLVKGQSNLSDLASWFRLVMNLAPKWHHPFILSTKLYQQALDLINVSPDLAYLNLVSAIEVLAQDHDGIEPGLEDLDGQLASLVQRVADRELSKQITERILGRERWISRKFVDLIVTHTDASFWDDERRPKLGKVEPEQLSDLMKKVYQQRSRTLHAGEPFPPHIFDRTHQGEELPLGLGYTVRGRKWERKDYIPYPEFMERLVNHVLRHFLERNQSGLVK
jgi:hypothetical protein